MTMTIIDCKKETHIYRGMIFYNIQSILAGNLELDETSGFAVFGESDGSMVTWELPLCRFLSQVRISLLLQGVSAC